MVGSVLKTQEQGQQQQQQQQKGINESSGQDDRDEATKRKELKSI